MNYLKSKLGALFLILFLLGSFSVNADSEKDCLYYFYGQECISCQETNTFIEKLELKHPDLQVNRLEVYHNGENAKLMADYFVSYKIAEPYQGVPTVFIGRSYLIGNEPISTLLEGSIIENPGSECPALSPSEKEEVFGGLSGEKEPRHILEILTFPIVTSAAIHDSFAPLGMLLLLVLSSCFLVIERKDLKKKSSYFIIGALLIIISFGLKILPSVNKISFLADFIALAGIILSIKEISRFFRKNKEIKIQKEDQPEKKFNQAKSYVFSSAGIFLMGVITAFISLSSLGKAFLLLREFSTESFTRTTALPLLFYFIILYIFPMIAITILTYFLEERFLADAKIKANNQKDLLRWQRHAVRLNHLIIGIFMLVISLLILIF